MNKLIVLIMLLTLTACKTVDINSAPDMHVSPNLTTDEIKYAIAYTVDKNIPTPKLDVAKTIMIRQVNGFSMNPLHATTTEFWFVEDVGTNYVTVGFDNAKHYFSVKYSIRNGVIKREIIDSRNLRQTDTSIHKNVFVWISRLDVKIKRSISAIIVAKQMSNS